MDLLWPWAYKEREWTNQNEKIFQNSESEKNFYFARLTLAELFSAQVPCKSFYGNVTIFYSCSKYEKQIQYERQLSSSLCYLCFPVFFWGGGGGGGAFSCGIREL